MIGEVKNEIDNAIIKLKLSQKDIFLLDNHAGEKVFNECISHFLNSGDRRWWWEDFKFPSFSLIEVVCTPSLVNLATDYRFSSANFYETGIDEFGILTHIEAWYN